MTVPCCVCRKPLDVTDDYEPIPVYCAECVAKMRADGVQGNPLAQEWYRRYEASREEVRRLTELVHDLETRTDPAGDVRRLRLLEEENRLLVRVVQELTPERDNARAHAAAWKALAKRLRYARDGARIITKSIATANEMLHDKLGSIARDLRIIVQRIEGP